MSEEKKGSDGITKAERRRRKEQSARDKAASAAASAPAKRRERRPRQQTGDDPRGMGQERERGFSTTATSDRQLSIKQMSTILPGEELISQASYPITADNTAGGSITVIRMNPGDPGMFPQGSTTCKNWVRWDPRRSRMRVIFTPTAGEYAANNQAGNLFLAFTSDPAANLPNTVVSMGRLQPNVKGRSDKTLVLTLGPEHFCPTAGLLRRASYYEGRNPQLYDGGALLIGVLGNSASGGVLGLLSIEYQFFLFEQRVPSVRIPVPLTGGYATSSQSVASGATVTFAPAAANIYVGFGTGVGIDSSGNIVLQGPGIYQIIMTLDPAPIASTFTGLTITSGATAGSGVIVQGQSQITQTFAAAAGVTDMSLTLTQIVTVLDGVAYSFQITAAQSNTGALATAVAFHAQVNGWQTC